MRQRIVTAIIALAALLLVLFVVPPVATRIVIGGLMLVGAWEWSGFLGTTGIATRIVYVALIGTMLVVVTLALTTYTELLLMMSMAWWLAALIWTFFFPTPIPAVIRWFAGAIVLVPLYAALMLLYEIEPAILLFALLIVWVADSGAYFAGKNFGRVKLAPRISPGKTWEGAIGGMVAVVLLIIGRSFWIDTNLSVLVPFCLAVVAVSIVGDLTVSMFKRTAGVKDSGTLFPGHGGVLDRIDSVAAATPLFALGMGWLGLR
ncbi:MAG: phosphatidate cytidylyltransferase [Proteobacteria bacterium]|nr:phosphatidate cytidylyltransferase [Pseudomonadota bacterium]